MSFSADVKNELLSYDEGKQSCLVSELAAIVNICGYVGQDGINVKSENKAVVGRLSYVLDRLGLRSADISEQSGKYTAHINAAGDIIRLCDIRKRGAYFYDTAVLSPISPKITVGAQCKRAYVRAAFLCCGSVTNPEKQYHLEFVNADYDHADALRGLIAYFGVETKIIERKNHFVVYIKEGEQIVDVLNIISAHRALMSFENLRILKEIRNKTNRIVNCETANIGKTVSAAQRQRDAIEYIASTVGLNSLPPSLREAARARLIYPFVSLKELGENMTPPVGKSGVNYRLKKICSLADNLREEKLL